MIIQHRGDKKVKDRRVKRVLVITGVVIAAFVFCCLVFNITIKAIDGKEIAWGDYVISVSANSRPVYFVKHNKEGEKTIIPKKMIFLPGVNVVKYDGNDEKVVIPKRMLFLPVTSIEEAAFEDNKSIKEVVFPSTLRAVGANAFNNCTALENVEFNGELNWIYEYAFFNCCSIKELSLPCSRQLEIEASAFESCTGLESVNFNDGNVSLGTYAFYDCEKLETVQGVDGEITAASDAFDNTAYLNNYDGDFFIIGSYLLKYLGNDTDIIIPENVTEIAYYAFTDRTMKSIHMPSGLSSFKLCFTDDDSALENKVRVYYGNADEFDVSRASYNNLIKNTILIAPADSAVIQYAKENGIEYIIE